MADRGETDARRLLLGVGLDSDGHVRVTKGDDFCLLGGSEDTHDRMQEDVDRLQHGLRKLGTDLQHATRAELKEAVERARRDA